MGSLDRREIAALKSKLAAVEKVASDQTELVCDLEEQLICAKVICEQTEKIDEARQALKHENRKLEARLAAANYSGDPKDDDCKSYLELLTDYVEADRLANVFARRLADAVALVTNLAGLLHTGRSCAGKLKVSLMREEHDLHRSEIEAWAGKLDEINDGLDAARAFLAKHPASEPGEGEGVKQAYCGFCDIWHSADTDCPNEHSKEEADHDDE